jgi:DNA-binding MarR family transcriptional regulator
MTSKNATSLSARWLTPSELEAWRSFIVVSRRVWEALDGDLAGHDLSLSDYEILAHLSEAPDRMMRMSDLAAQAIMSRSRLSHRITVMEKAGWVKRQSCPTDKRGSFAVMTAKGWNAISAAAPDHVDSIRKRFMDHLTQSEQSSIEKIFKKVGERLREQEGL